MGKTNAAQKERRKERHRPGASRTQAKNGRPKDANRQRTNNKSAGENRSILSSQQPSGRTRIVQSPSLGPSLPPLVITYTNEQSALAAWLQEHVRGNEVMCLGLDTETKPCFTTEAALAQKGPDVLQLATAEGTCLVIHLSQMERLQDLRLMFGASNVSELLENPRAGDNMKRIEGYIRLYNVLKDPNIIKAGVGIDQDALEMHDNKCLSTNCRLDLRTVNAKPGDASVATDTNIGQDSKEDNALPQGLKGLTEYYVPGMIVPKKQKLQMSNWAATQLSDQQVEYAAADAFAAAITVQTLISSSDNPHSLTSIIRTVMSDEVDIANLRQDRARKKRQKQRERAELKKQRKKPSKNGKARST